jgi:PAS domain S-box-containing protein
VEDVTRETQAEEAHRQSEQRYRNLFHQNHAVMLLIDPKDGKIVDANPAACAYYGYSLEEITGLAITDINTLPPERIQAIIQRLQTTSSQHLFFQHRLADGRIRDVEVFAGPIAVEGRELLHSIVQDITERKRAEEALRESEQRFAAFMLHIPAATWMKDLQGRYIYANVETERYFSIPLATLWGKTDQDLMPPATAREFRETDEQLLAGGGSLKVMQALPQADGSERHFIVDKFVVPAADGRPACIAGVAFDITDLRRAEEALRESEERYHTLFESIDEGFCVIEMIFDENDQPTDYRFIEVNSIFEAQSGINYPVGRRMREIAPAHEEHWFEIYGRVAVTGEAVRFQNSAAAFNRYFDVYAFRVGAPEQSQVAVLFRDITDRKQTEEKVARLNAELEKANRELEAFNYTVAHDLRNPLTVIGGYCQLIEKLCGPMLDEQCKGFMQEIYDSSRHMNRLIDALLNFSRMDRVVPQRKTVDLSDIAHRVAGELRRSGPDRRARFRIADGAVGEGDPNMLWVVLSNLLGNAWKYTGQRNEGEIEFGVAGIEGETVYFVGDNGTGFSPQEAEKIFHPFERLANAGDFQGFGIGLATVERIVHRHGGRIWAKGEPDRGATFYFTLGTKTED